jgi:hypothetical protein
MKLINKIIFGSFLLSIVFSCKKQLELRPIDSIDDTKAFQSVADLEKGMFGVYSSYGAGVYNGYYIGSILADEAKISNENRGQGQFSFKWQYTAGTGEHNNDYATFYRAIDRAHRVLAAMEQVSAATPQEATLKSRIQAELIALRAMSHYQLLIRFMPDGYNASALGVPVMLKSDLLGLPARNTVGEVITQIETDLNAARNSSDLPSSVADGLRISKAAVAGYQARVALLKRDWANAITYATDAITLSGTSLATIAQYPAIWGDAVNNEVILRFRNNYSITLYWRDTNGDVFFEPSDKLKAQYNRVTDVRFSTFFGSVTTGGQNDTSTVKKFPGSAQGPQSNDIKDIRISEMYLIRAEANAELNQLTNAANDVNAVISNRITGYTNVTFATKDEAITAILNERFKELAFEGFRFFDLKRRSLPITRFASDVQSPNWQTLAASNFRFAMPIPQFEIFANPNTVQNPGY